MAISCTDDDIKAKLLSPSDGLPSLSKTTIDEHDVPMPCNKERCKSLCVADRPTVKFVSPSALKPSNHACSNKSDYRNVPT